MRKLMLAATALVALAAPADAAEIWSKPINKAPAVFIKGKIERGDEEMFNKVTARLPAGRTWVVMTSPGGLMAPALMIGETIRTKRFGTIALNDCVSACALAWIAGVPRAVFSDSGVGFHAMYEMETKDVSSSGNAIVGAYLTRLGLSYGAIDYLTTAAPDSMEWLTAETAKKYGITVRVFKD
jgi:hypothetical protein